MSRNHQIYMQRAIELAKRGRFTTTPNPNVGCVIVDMAGNVVGEGWHHKAGEPHAEVHALQQAGDKAKGATCYVTLEPCSHFGRTPPCADRLVEAGVAEVVCAMEDPNPSVAGKGFDKLIAAGIKVTIGLLNQEANAINPRFLTAMRENRSFIQVKLASSLDGKTALSNGDSQWITGPAARQDVQDHRAEACAIISSAQTVIADNASLNVRWEQSVQLQSLVPQSHVRQPVRVIIDTQHRLNPYIDSILANASLKLFQINSPVILVRTHATPSEQQQCWPAHVSELVIENNSDSNHVDLHTLTQALFDQKLHQLWIEAGAALAGAFVANGLVDELVLYQAPKFIGHAGQPLLQLPEACAMRDISSYSISSITPIGEDIKLIIPMSKPVATESTGLSQLNQSTTLAERDITPQQN